MKYDKIIENLEAQLNELKKLREEEMSLQFSNEALERIKLLAKKSPFKKHVLTNFNDSVRELYITGLMSVFDDEKAPNAEHEKMLYLGRIIASYDPKIDFRKYNIKFLKIDTQYWNKFVEIINGDLAVYFAVDMLLIYKLIHKDDRNMSNLVEVLGLLQLGKDVLEKLLGMVKAILQQDFYAFLDCVDGGSVQEYSCFLTYFNDVEYDYICTDLLECGNIDGKIVVANDVVYDYDKIICFDEYLAEEITFYKCTFENIYGMKSFDKWIVFNGCVFENNILIIAYDKHKHFYGTDNKNSFIEMNNVDFLDVKFRNCKYSDSILNLNNAYLENCRFEHCYAKEAKSNSILEVTGSDIKNCIFDECILETAAYSSSALGAIVEMSNSKIENTIFNNCKSTGENTNRTMGTHHMYILLASSSTIKDCRFSNCVCTHYGYGGGYDCSIVGVQNTMTERLYFDECECAGRNRNNKDHLLAEVTISHANEEAHCCYAHTHLIKEIINDE